MDVGRWHRDRMDLAWLVLATNWKGEQRMKKATGFQILTGPSRPKAGALPTVLPDRPPRCQGRKQHSTDAALGHSEESNEPNKD